MKAPDYEFLRAAGRVLNSGQARTLVISGAIHDLFFLPGPDGDGQYVPLAAFLSCQWDLPERILVVYELNGPIRFLRDADRSHIRDAWLKFRTGLDSDQLAIQHMLRGGTSHLATQALQRSFDDNLQQAIGRPTLALELLRQMCVCSRTQLGSEALLTENLIIIIEAADALIPEAPIHQLPDADRHRLAICQDWFCEPGFAAGGDSVILLAESRSLLNQRIAALPQVLEVQAWSADRQAREHFVDWFDGRQPASHKLRMAMGRTELVDLTAGLSIHALTQLLKGACHENRALRPADVVAKVEAYIQSQLGEDIVEFKKPGHTLDDVVGYDRLKEFLRSELIPRLQSTGPDALPGAAVCGPIGSGKTFIFEAVAAELGIVVLTLKNIRSQWFGQTDVIFERLRRVLEALAKVLIFVDEADTQFGEVGPDAHATERRLTGKIQAMMSDAKLRGKVAWLLMTARIHLLSPDIRRPGRTGDLIIPVLDPEGPDREQFLRWMVKPALGAAVTPEQLARLGELTAGYSAAAFASLRSELAAWARRAATPADTAGPVGGAAAGVGAGAAQSATSASTPPAPPAAAGPVAAASKPPDAAAGHAGGAARPGGTALDFPRICEIVHDHLSPTIGEARRYQTLQALANCTRRCLLPNPDVDDAERQKWLEEIRRLETRGIR